MSTGKTGPLIGMLLAMAGLTLSLVTAAAGQQQASTLQPSADEQPSAAQESERGPRAGMGIMVGEVTPESALVQVRLTRTDRLVEGDVLGAMEVVEFTLQPADGAAGTGTQKQLINAVPERDFIARVSFHDLHPDTSYRCTTRIGTDAEQLRDGPAAEFKTPPGADAATRVRMVVVTGMNYAKFHGNSNIDRLQHVLENNTELPPPYAGADKQLGYPALASILKLQPDYFVGT
jgi:alkaline phosphatase/alkaline phosphatase D